jgi:hypothetical protein
MSAAFKITMMSASMGGMLWRPEISADAYPSPLDLVRDLVTLQIEEIEGLIDQGVRWIQLDSLGYNQVLDEQFRVATGLGGVPPEAILDATVTADAELVRAAKRKDPGVAVGIAHLPGQQPQRLDGQRQLRARRRAAVRRGRGRSVPARVRHRTGRRV